MDTGKLTPEQVAALRVLPFGQTAGNRVAFALALAQVSQTECGNATGLHQQFISSLKRGATAVTPAVAKRLADYFGCEVEDLFPSPYDTPKDAPTDLVA